MLLDINDMNSSAVNPSDVNPTDVNSTDTLQKHRLTQKTELKTLMETAGSFAILLLPIFIGIKIVLLFTESSIKLQFWEWFAIWPAITYQHIIAAIIVFGIYTGILFLGKHNRNLGIAALVLVCIIQFLVPFLHISSLRVAQILGGYTTFEMIQADSEGSIYSGALSDLKNLPYTLSGAVLSTIALLIPLLLRHRFVKVLSNISWKKYVIIASAWIVAGIVTVRLLTSFISMTESDPILFFFSDMIQKESGLSYVSDDTSLNYPTEQIFGDNNIVETASLFSNLEQWKKTKRNVILIVMESLPAAQASFMGKVERDSENRDTTPNLKALRKNMLTWNNHYSVHPTSMNSLFSINCSMYPYPEGGTITGTNPKIPCQSISEILTQKGYKAALFHSGKLSFWRKHKFFASRGYSLMKDAAKIKDPKVQTFHWGIDEQVMANSVVDFIEKNKSKPFFIQYITLFPHTPYDYVAGPWAVYPEKELIDKYHNCVRYADASIKIVTDAVKKMGLEKDTLFVFVGDHGEAFYEHPGNRVHSIFVYEENVHVAFGMLNPLLFPKSKKTERVTSHIDILPTVAELLDIPRRDPWQGYSLLENRPSPLVYFFANWGTKFGAVRDGQYKAIWNKDKNSMQIFDLNKDPKERKNLSNVMKERVDPYRKAIKRWWDYQVKLIPSMKP